VKESLLRAVAYCEEKVFTVDFYKSRTLSVFDGNTFKLITTLDIGELVSFSMCDFVSCSDTMQLFIAGDRAIWRVDISSIYNLNINMFVSHERGVKAMSSTRRRLLVTSKDEVHSLVVYDVVSSERLQSVQLRRFMNPTHSIETTINVFIVSHRGVSRDQNGVSQVNSSGHVTRAFNGLLNAPDYLTLDSLGRILVFDEKWNVLLFSGELKYERILVNIQQLVDKQTTTAQSSRTIISSLSWRRMCCDKKTQRLFVVRYKQNIESEIIVLKY